MTTILQSPPSGDSSYNPTSIHPPSFSDFASLDTSASYIPEKSSKSSYIHAEYEKNYPSSAPSSAPSSPPSSPTFTHFSRHDSYSSTPASSLSLGHDDNCEDHDEEDDDEDDIGFSPYDQASVYPTPQYVTSRIEEEPSTNRQADLFSEDRSVLPERTNDDQAVEFEPTRHVDYLSHEWREEDIWSSWRYIVARRKKINNSVRLENASWRTWMKAKYNLKTISPETLNWLKDCDVTWLYGPLQTDKKRSIGRSPPPSHMSTSSSFVCRKPILKKKSASAAILERSRSQQSLLQRASDIIRVQQSNPVHGRPVLGRTAEFALPSYTGSSVANTPAELDTPMGLSHRYSFHFPEPPTPADQKHVAFDSEVRQVRAIESDEDEKDEFETAISESDEDDDGGLMMAPVRSRSSSRSTPRTSFSNEGKTIAPLPSTTLKRTDTPDLPSHATKGPAFWPAGKGLSPSPSQETLRPSRPSQNYLIDDDPELSDEPWGNSSTPGFSPYEDENEPGPTMRRTPSGMFMPYDENEEEAAINKTLFGQAMYAVNTFRDIAHVVWNVGWTRK